MLVGPIGVVHSTDQGGTFLKAGGKPVQKASLSDYDTTASGQLFVFRNKRADRVKLLYWDEDGFVILYKRLEAGTFHLPKADAASVPLRAADLQMLLDGVEWDSVKRSRRYRRPAPHAQ